MTRISRYLLKELLVPLGVWVAFLFLLLFVMQFLLGTDVLLGASVTLVDVARLIVYLTPRFLMMALPVAFLLAILLGLGRLGEDHELTALQSLGVGPARLLAAPMGIAVVLSALMLLITSTALSWGSSGVAELVSEVIQRNAVGEVKPGTFYENFGALTLYTEEVSPDGQWTNVLLHDEREQTTPLLVVAHRGKVGTASGSQVLRFALEGGEVHRSARASESYELIHFDRAEINLEFGGASAKGRRFTSSKEETTLMALYEAAQDAKANGGYPHIPLTAMHSRLGAALAPMAFALLGTPLAIGRRQAGKAWGYLLTLGGYVLYYMLSRVFEQFGQQGRLPPLLAGQLANLIFMAMGLVALYRVSRSGTLK
ncbi:LptF/LptG family permease [Myxococcus sp. K38C18041901]|uniref:LptF/LptG family permease n=1 Tax=Myxococcus guangdongensis TaxID=2906760 RepID=UPI0020A7EEB3|nr:LptF/LptG family permease [Myxococcus guangdongensis]MCP3062372.1 LptF/LptG family permease [Myxococcus guangdongensis]